MILMVLPDAEAKTLCEVRAMLTDLIVSTTDEKIVEKLREARKMIQSVM